MELYVVLVLQNILWVTLYPSCDIVVFVAEAALNLFINSNAQELLREMKPSIKKKLLVTLRHFIENLFDRIPYNYWITD